MVVGVASNVTDGGLGDSFEVTDIDADNGDTLYMPKDISGYHSDRATSDRQHGPVDAAVESELCPI